jgi:putative hydrolase of the HAD superfamily
MPNAIKVLDYLVNRYNLYIITNGFKNVQNHKIESSNIKKYFLKIYDSESIGVKKPNPIFFNHALSDSNSIKSESLMIGDSFEADIEGAMNVGMNAIHFIAHDENIHSKCKIINDLDELMNLL